ncbi:hypothetical protein QUF63_09000 [Anaerolineales bacterium HSG25]|nr:hypothetical protein [Anaerolineales bacterium HSG25]
MNETTNFCLFCGGQDDVGVQWVQPLLLATAKPVALHFQHQSDHDKLLPIYTL